MTDTQVVIAGVEVFVLERLPEPRTVESRAGGLHIRTMETLDQRGLLGRFLECGRRRQSVRFSALRLDVSDAVTRHPYVLVIMQSEVERLLTARAKEVGVRLRRGTEVRGTAAPGRCDHGDRHQVSDGGDG